MPSWVHTDAQQLHSLPAWCLSVNSCAFLKWICLRTLSPTLFYSLSWFSAVCLFFLCLIELSGPAHWHDNSLKMLWSLMHICRFHFIGAILFLYQIILLLTIFTCIITLKRNHDIFFSVLSFFTEFNGKELAGVSSYCSQEWKYLHWKLKFKSVSLISVVSYHTFSNL